MTTAPKPPTWNVTRTQRSRARSLRRTMTDAERIIWNGVRAHRLADAGFRRQAPIGRYIVDFVCHDARLIVEIDGGQHFTAGHSRRDQQRDSNLVAEGYRVLRFNNHDVMTNRAGVLQTIAAALKTPSPPLPRKRGREPAAVAAIAVASITHGDSDV